MKKHDFFGISRRWGFHHFVVCGLIVDDVVNGGVHQFSRIL